MKFTFVYPDFEYDHTPSGRKVVPGGWYAEGIAQLAAILERRGVETDLLHITQPLEQGEYLQELNKRSPDIVGFAINTPTSNYAKKLARWTKDAEVKTVAGSYHPTLSPEDVIHWDGIDAICIGEGENPLAQFVDNINSKRSVENIGSIWVKRGNGAVKRNPVQPMAESLSRLPLPKFDIFDFDKLFSSQGKTAVVVLSRGCPYHCTYCWNNFAWNLYPNKKKYVRFRTPKNSIRYLKKLLEIYPDVKALRFQDDLLPAYDEWLWEFAKLYKKEINLSFVCNYRANLLTGRITKRLAEIGCREIYFGVESGNDYIRNKILKRNMTQKAMEDAFKWCHKYGIKPLSYNIVGLPHEDIHKVLDTIKFNAKLKPHQVFSPVYFPYPGTELYDMGIEAGFHNPKEPVRPHVNIMMPHFPPRQVRFSSLYFRTFLSLYKLAFRLPRFVRGRVESIFDRVFTWSILPYIPGVIEIVVWKRGIEKWVKDTVRSRLTGVYLRVKGYGG